MSFKMEEGVFRQDGGLGTVIFMPPMKEKTKERVRIWCGEGAIPDNSKESKR